jgi:hypothetical protein
MRNTTLGACNLRPDGIRSREPSLVESLLANARAIPVASRHASDRKRHRIDLSSRQSALSRSNGWTTVDPLPLLPVVAAQAVAHPATLRFSDADRESAIFN